MHVVNHLYFQKIRESRGKKPNSDIWKRFCQPGNLHCDSLQKPWWLSDFFFFFLQYFCIFCWKSWREKTNKAEFLSVGFFIDLSDSDLLPLKHSIEHSQVKGGRVVKNCGKLHMLWSQFPRQTTFDISFSDYHTVTIWIQLCYNLSSFFVFTLIRLTLTWDLFYTSSWFHLEKNRHFNAHLL